MEDARAVERLGVDSRASDSPHITVRLVHSYCLSLLARVEAIEARVAALEATQRAVRGRPVFRGGSQDA